MYDASKRNAKPAALFTAAAAPMAKFDTRAAAGGALENTALRLLHSSDPKAALFPAAKAVEMAPSSARAHYYHCVALAFSGYPQQEIPECETAIKLAERDPLHRSDLLIQDAGEIIRNVRTANNMPNP